MKKFYGLIVTFALFSQPAFAVDQWDKAQLAGTIPAADIDAYSQVNAVAQDRLLYNYRYGAAVIPNSAASVDVLAGEIALPNSDGSVVKYRRNTSTTNVPWGSIDTGAEEVSTTYYVWAVADADASTFTCKISKSSSAPGSSTYYRKLGSFYNNASSTIENVQNYRNDEGAKYRDIINGRINFDASGTVTINDSFNVTSVTDDGTGKWTITWDTDFANANYSVVATGGASSFGLSQCQASSYAVGSVQIYCASSDGTGFTDPDTVSVIASGDRA